MRAFETRIERPHLVTMLFGLLVDTPPAAPSLRLTVGPVPARSARVVVAVALLLLAASAAYASPCADNIASLRRLTREPAFPLYWIETDMTDGKPLHLVLTDGERALQLRFTKSGEGLWAAGVGQVCLGANGLEARFEPGQLIAGPAAGWLLQKALQSSARFTLARTAQGQLQVATFGWQGRFAAAAGDPRP
ncbi:MAG TPA: hypothetical protein VLJ86_08750 [Ramlibacter sp.]|nr:hypothetical protein [Ramlibacter sp.]